MGNTVVWKPSPTQQLAAHLTMELLEEAGLPPGVINMLPGDGVEVSEVALAHPDLAGIHFTGSTPTFQHLWRTVGENIASYRSYPRIVGETGGKDFVVAHPSARPRRAPDRADPGRLRVPGQKCSAASRAYVPRSVWRKMRDAFVAEVESVPMGDVTDLSNFMGAVIDDRAFAKHKKAIARAKRSARLEVLAGGQVDDSVGYFVRPTVVERPTRPTRCSPPSTSARSWPCTSTTTRDFEGSLEQMESFAPYALTGAIIAQDRQRDRLGARDAPVRGRQLLHQRQADRRRRRPAAVRRGARVGHQRQGRFPQNLMRWTSPRSIKETFDPPKDYRYPYMERERTGPPGIEGGGGGSVPQKGTRVPPKSEGG